MKADAIIDTRSLSLRGFLNSIYKCSDINSRDNRNPKWTDNPGKLNT